MIKRKKIFLYIFFATISSIFNLLTQRVILYFSKSDLFFFLAIILGTLAGLIIKFFLDKSYIFVDNKKEILYVSEKFGLYSFMGIFSTMVFWSTEYIFWIIWRQENMRELGAILGLTFGYIIKYKLDKKYVFKR